MEKLNINKNLLKTNNHNNYPTDLTKEQWDITKPMIPKAKHGG